MAAVADGYGSLTTSRPSLSQAFFISRPRVCEFGAWLQNTIALTLLSWSISSFFSSTASTQRDTVVPDFSIIACEANCFLTHSSSTPHTAAQCFQEPVARP